MRAMRHYNVISGWNIIDFVGGYVSVRKMRDGKFGEVIYDGTVSDLQFKSENVVVRNRMLRSRLVSITTENSKIITIGIEPLDW